MKAKGGIFADFDLDGLGDINNSLLSCTALLGYVDNSDDPEPGCPTNDTFVCGICGGCEPPPCEEYEEDCAFVCFGSAVDDACGICNGNGCYLQDCETYPSEFWGCTGCEVNIDCNGLEYFFIIFSIPSI